MKKRLYMLDVLRILCAIMTFMFHTAIHMGTSFGLLQTFVKQGAVFMTGFFMLSGFLLAYQHGEQVGQAPLRRFYIKRAFAIYPVYWVTAIAYELCFQTLPMGQLLLSAPVEITGLQAIYASLFSMSHNGGTWFISCILMSYALFPFMAELAQKLRTRRSVMACMVAVGVIAAYLPMLESTFEVQSLYANPIERMLEFLLGVLLCRWVSLRAVDGRRRPARGLVIALMATVCLVCAVSLMGQLPFFAGKYIRFDALVLPYFGLMIWLGATDLRDVPVKAWIRKALQVCSGLCYTFFCGQLFCFKASKVLCAMWGWQQPSKRALALSLLICTAISVLLHWGVELPILRLYRKKAAPLADPTAKINL